VKFVIVGLFKRAPVRGELSKRSLFMWEGVVLFLACGAKNSIFLNRVFFALRGVFWGGFEGCFFSLVIFFSVLIFFVIEGGAPLVLKG